MITEECTCCGEVIVFKSEAARQQAYKEGDSSEAFCDKCKGSD